MGTPGLKEFFGEQKPWIPDAETSEELDLSVDTYMNVRLKDFLDWGLRVSFLAKEEEENPTVFMWRVDGCAVYVPLPQEPNSAAEAFLTSDSTELRLLLEMFDRHWELARPRQTS